MKPELVVVIGAGASIPCGIAGTPALTELAFENLPEAFVTAPGHVLKDVGRLSGYGETTFQLKTLIADALNATFEEVNFELLLNALEELEPFAFFGGKSPLSGRPTMTAFAEVARRFGPLGDRYIVHAARRYVIEAIHRHVGEQCAKPANTAAVDARSKQELFVLECAKYFRLIVIDLNYDDLFDRIGLDWEDGFRKKSPADKYALFDPVEWNKAQNDGEKHLLIHLHGSVRFGHSNVEDTSQDFYQPGKYDDPGAAAETFVGRSKSERIVDGRPVSAFPIISGRDKAAKLAHNTRPFAYYFSALAAALVRVPRLMAIGYGGADEHLGTWIREHKTLHDNQRKAAALIMRPGRTVGDYTPQWYLLNDLTGKGARVLDCTFAGCGQEIWYAGPLLFAPDGVPTAYRHTDEIISHLSVAP